MWNKLRPAEKVYHRKEHYLWMYVCAVQIVLVPMIMMTSNRFFAVVQERSLQLNPFYGLKGTAPRRDKSVICNLLNIDTLNGYFIGSSLLWRLPFSSSRSNNILHIGASCSSAGSGRLKDEIDGWTSTEQALSYRNKSTLSVYMWLHLFKSPLDDIRFAAAMIRRGHMIGDSTAFSR
jgi:hypothetical protein